MFSEYKVHSTLAQSANNTEQLSPFFLYDNIRNHSHIWYNGLQTKILSSKCSFVGYNWTKQVPWAAYPYHWGSYWEASVTGYWVRYVSIAQCIKAPQCPC